MNLDELKDAWGKDVPPDMTLPVSAALQGQTSSAINRIRGNMRWEFFITLIGYVIMGFLLLSRSQAPLFLIAGGAALFILLLQNGYYFFSFYLFYRTMSRYDFNMRESVRKVVYELELNTEVYKTYNFCIIPLTIIIVITILGGKGLADYLLHLLTVGFSVTPVVVLWGIVTLFFSLAITHVCINLHIHLRYGKYIAALKTVVHELENEA